MRLRTVTAPDARQAMAKLRAALGDEAMIVAPQQVDGGVRITGAVEHDEIDLGDLLAAPPASPWLERLTRVVARQELPEGVRARLLDAVRQLSVADPIAELGQALHQLYRFAPLPQAARLLLTGTPGTGKTASIVKLAARAVLEGRTVDVLTTDVGRAGGVEQLKSLLAPLHLEPRPAAEPRTLKRLAEESAAALVLEFPGADSASLRTSRLVTVDQQRLEPPVPIRLRPASAAQPAATVRSAAGLQVKLRALGPEGRPLGPPLAARLVPVPEAGSIPPGSRPSAPPPAPVAVIPRGAVAPSAGTPAPTTLPMNATPVPTTTWAGVVSPAPSTALSAPATKGNAGPPAHNAAPEQAQVLMVRDPIEVTVLRRDRGRVLLRGAGVTFAVETPVGLPVGARLQLTFPAWPARSDSAPESGPLKAVRELTTWLSEEAGPGQPVNAAAPRLPQATATLAARLLRLIQLITKHGGATGLCDATEPAGAEAQSGAPRITAALAELGRLAGGPQSGGWRAFLLPLGFEGAPMLRLYLREESDQEEGDKERRPAKSPTSRRAVFELEFGELGRCQIDVPCQAERFDLNMRTEQPLDPHLCREIRELYVAARDVAGLVGEVRFRTGGWVVLPDLSCTGSAGTGITV